METESKGTSAGYDGPGEAADANKTEVSGHEAAEQQELLEAVSKAQELWQNIRVRRMRGGTTAE